jgi:histidinol-phosphate/aromatic aminotransferase/cobyric acid decarboxylase-like protein
VGGVSAARVPAPGAHGGDGRAVAAALGLDPGSVLDLSQSLNPVAPDVTAVVARYLHALRAYPDPRRATAALAAAMGVDAECLVLTNGGSEAIALVAAELGGRVDEPEFSLHPRGVGPRWRSNPHNPTGLLAAPGERAGVWDEAFYPLATGCWTRGDDDAVVGSLTKLLACPGLRIGYVLGAPELVARVREHQPHWAVNALAAASLPELLDTVDLPAWSARVGVLRGALAEVLAGHGLVAERSDANWVLVESPGLRARLAPTGVIVRDCSSFGLPGTVRIAVPSERGLERLDAALAATAPSRPGSRRRSAFHPPPAPDERHLERTT